MNLSQRIRLYPNKTQTAALGKAAGTARYTYNWALAEWTRQYKAGGKPSAMALKKQWNACKPEWVYESPKDANQQPFASLNTAFQRFFKKQGKYPVFKCKGGHDSFYVSNDKFTVDAKDITLPKIGRMRMAEVLRFKGKLVSGTVSCKAGKWYVSISVETQNKRARSGNNTVGVDLGLKHFATLSTGEQLNAPKPLKAYLKRLRRYSQAVSNKVKGSKNRAKAKLKVARVHSKISDIRNDFIHKATTKLCRENQTIVVEDLAVQNMQKNRRLSRAISGAGWGEFRRQLVYKAKIWDNTIVVAPRFYPSSKTCSACGVVKQNLALTERVFECASCGLSLDRDLNAAQNLYTLGSREIQACGLGVGPTRAAEGEAGTNECADLGLRT